MTACTAIPHMAVKKKRHGPGRENAVASHRHGSFTNTQERKTPIIFQKRRKSHNIASVAISVHFQAPKEPNYPPQNEVKRISLSKNAVALHNLASRL